MRAFGGTRRHGPAALLALSLASSSQATPVSATADMQRVASVGPKTLYVVRHGQAQHNPRAEAAKVAGCSMDRFLQLMQEDDAFDAELTDIGRDQARATSIPRSALAGLQLVVSSPLSRALETADLLLGPSDAPASLNRVCCEHFREVNGMLLNAKRRPASDLQLRFPQWNFSDIPSADLSWTDQLETFEHCADRGYRGLCWILQRPETEILLVAHGGILRFTMTLHPNIKVRDERTGSDHKQPDARFENCELRKYRVEWEQPVPDTYDPSPVSATPENSYHGSLTPRTIVLTQVDL